MDDRKHELVPAGLLARQLRVPVRWLKEEATAGRLPHIRAEQIFLFDSAAVEAVLLERAATVPASAGDRRPTR